MKTLIILSAFLLVLSSCTKEMPCPYPDSDPGYIPDPSPEPDPAPDPNSGSDSGDDDPSPCRNNNHPGTAITWVMATSLNPVG